MSESTHNDDYDYIQQGDCLALMAAMPEASVDAIVTDPPYGLGFMGKAWDALPPGEEWARACLRVLKPGGHLLAFGGTRTWHRLATAIEEAEFELRDSIAWLYGSGYPKSRGVLKPGFEPIVVARKPFRGPVSANVAAHGTGALNISACRAGSERWPANVALDEIEAARLDEQAGDRPTGAVHPYVSTHDPSQTAASFSRGGSQRRDYAKPADGGGASRFFYVSKAPKSERPVVDGVSHPTVKPLTLMRWLVRLAAPTGGIVLDPFAGSGTTLEAALLEGLHPMGIELAEEYIPLIRERLSRVAAAEGDLFGGVA